MQNQALSTPSSKAAIIQKRKVVVTCTFAVRRLNATNGLLKFQLPALDRHAGNANFGFNRMSLLIGNGREGLEAQEVAAEDYSVYFCQVVVLGDG